MIGIVLKDASARRQSFIIMITTTPMTVINSGIRVVTIFVRTSFSELTSPMILARIFPVGLLSKNEKDHGHTVHSYFYENDKKNVQCERKNSKCDQSFKI